MTAISLPIAAAQAEPRSDPRLVGDEEQLGPGPAQHRPDRARARAVLDVTIQPVIFVLLFTYVFGSAIHLPGGGNYHQFLISGMFGMAMAGIAPGTAVGMTADMSTGLIDRFRSLPISRSAVLAGRTLSPTSPPRCSASWSWPSPAWRWAGGSTTAIGDALLAAGLSLLFAFAMTWAGACAGMLLRSPEAAQALGFVFFLPLSFVSNAFVPTQGMPSWLRHFANWNPMSAIAAACRNLFGGEIPAPARLADAASRAGRADLVDRADRGLRPDRRLPLPAQGPALSRATIRRH